MTAPRVTELHAVLDRTRERVSCARSELSRFCDSGLYGDPNAERTHRKLLADLERAQTDMRWAQQSIEAAMSVEGMDL